MDASKTIILKHFEAICHKMLYNASKKIQIGWKKFQFFETQLEDNPTQSPPVYLVIKINKMIKCDI
jgi:hypothetical protein